MIRAVASLIVAMTFAASVDFAAAQFTPTYETVAITEFMTRPIGETDGRQWVELYNFGDQPVSTKGFTLTNDSQELCEIPVTTIQPHDFAIVVLGHDHRRPGEDRKQIFEREWLGGKADPRVLAIVHRYVLHSADSLILKNARKAPIWILGYSADDKPGQSTYLAIDDFRVRMYGTKEKPSINRHGPDGNVLGYEGQDAKQEEVAWTSDVSKLEEIAGYLYQAKSAGGTAEPGVGSPLKGNYPGAKK